MPQSRGRARARWKSRLRPNGQPTVNAGNIVYGSAPVALADGGTLQAFDVRFSALGNLPAATATAPAAPAPVPEAAVYVPRTDAQIASAALLFNQWSNIVSAPQHEPLAFVPAQAGHEMLMGAGASPSPLHAANETA